MEPITTFIENLDLAVQQSGIPLKPYETTQTATGATRYYRLEPTQETPYIEIELKDGQITAVVSSNGQAATGDIPTLISLLRLDCASRLEEAGITPAFPVENPAGLADQAPPTAEEIESHRKAMKWADKDRRECREYSDEEVIQSLLETHADSGGNSLGFARASRQVALLLSRVG